MAMEGQLDDPGPSMDADIVKKDVTPGKEEGEASDSDQENASDDGFGWKVPLGAPAKRKKRSKSSTDGKKRSKKHRDKGKKTSHEDAIVKDKKGEKNEEVLKKKGKKKKEKKKKSWMSLTPGSSSSDSETDERVDTSNSWYGVFRGSENDEVVTKGHKSDRRSASKESSKSKKSKTSSWYDLPEEVIGSFGLRGIGREASVRPESPPRRSSSRNERRPSPPPRSWTPPRYPSPPPRSPPRIRSPPRPNDFYDLSRRSQRIRTPDRRTRSPERRTSSPERRIRSPESRIPKPDISDLDRMNPIGKSKKQPDGFWSKKLPDEDIPSKSRSRTRSPVPIRKAYGRDDRYDYRPPSRSKSPDIYRSTSPPVRGRVYRYYQTDEVRERDRRRIQSYHNRNDAYSPPPPPTHRNRSRYTPPPRAPSPARTEVSISTIGTSRSKRTRRSCSRARRIYTEDEKIDKAKLLSIARENLMKMVDSGTLPTGIDINRFKLKHLRELKDAKSIQEWTEFCRAISAMEAAAYSDSSLSGSDIDSDDDDDIKSVISEVTFKGRHPFVVAPKPEIHVKVRDFVTLKTRDAGEVQKDLRESFPVSSGDRHRAIEWKQIQKEMGPPTALPPRPVKKKVSSIPKEQPDDSITFLRARMEAEGIPVMAEDTPDDVMDCPVVGADGATASSTDQVFPESNLPKIDIGTVMSQRLSAMRVLQDDPLNVVALKQMSDAQEMMDAWSKQCIKPGQWLGQTGAKVLTPEEIHSGPQAWAKPDALQNTIAIEGGIGKYLLKRMGWCEGKGLGRFENGPLDPVLPILKFDTAGLRSEDEMVKKLQVQLVSPPVPQPRPSGGPANPSGAKTSGFNSDKNPVVEVVEIPAPADLPISRLSRYCLQKRYPPPEYGMAEESGPPHKPNFTMKVKVNNVWYQPTVSVRTKRGAKHLAASVCLQAFGLLPRDS